MKTKVMPKTLNPIWNETLIFNVKMLKIDLERIKIELWD